MVSEYRQALQALLDPMDDYGRPRDLSYRAEFRSSLRAAKALLARPEPEPRITREEAEKLLERYVDAILEWRVRESRASPAELNSAREACLAAMLRSEPVEITAEKPAIPRMKPRTVPLDDDPEIAALQAQHSEAMAAMQKQSERYQKLVAFFTNEDFNQAMEVRSFYYECGNTRESFEKAVDTLP